MYVRTSIDQRRRRRQARPTLNPSTSSSVVDLLRYLREPYSERRPSTRRREISVVNTPIKSVADDTLLSTETSVCLLASSVSDVMRFRFAQLLQSSPPRSRIYKRNDATRACLSFCRLRRIAHPSAVMVRILLAQRGISHGPVSVRLSVCPSVTSR